MIITPAGDYPPARRKIYDIIRAAAVIDGYLLTEKEFAAILAAADEYRSAALRELAEVFDQDARDAGERGTVTGSALKLAYHGCARLAREKAEVAP